MLKIKKILFSKMFSEIEEIAIKNKVWGNNIETALLTSKCISKHQGLFDIDMFLHKIRLTQINGSFRDLNELKHWLDSVNALFIHYLDNTYLRSVPDDYKWVTEFNPKTCRLRSFFGDDDRQRGIRNYIDYTYMLLEKNHELSKKLPGVVNETMRVKLSNGFNTILVINELILEVMAE